MIKCSIVIFFMISSSEIRRGIAGEVILLICILIVVRNHLSRVFLSVFPSLVYSDYSLISSRRFCVCVCLEYPERDVFAEAPKARGGDCQNNYSSHTIPERQLAAGNVRAA